MLFLGVLLNKELTEIYEKLIQKYNKYEKFLITNYVIARWARKMK